MGLSERFREQLETYNILEPEKYENQNKYKDNKKITVSIETQIQSKVLDEIAQKAIDKISKTPYWNEYPCSKQEKMLGNYFEAKYKIADSSEISNTITDKNIKMKFIKNVLSKISL